MTVREGIHQIDCAMYHADPCEEPSLSASGIGVLLNQTPAHFAAQHPRLTSWPIEHRRSEAVDLGSVVHALILGEGAAYAVKSPSEFLSKKGEPYKTWSGEAAEWKRARQAAGEIVIEPEEFDQAKHVAGVLETRFREKFGTWPIGVSESAAIWRRETENGLIWCRSLNDHLAIDDDAALIVDIKTTQRCVSDPELSKKLAIECDDIQNAWYIEGIETLHPNLAGRVRFIFAVAEVDPPYSVRFAELAENWLTRARFRIDRAANTFADCLHKKAWPSWPADALLNPPSWMEAQWEAEELRGGV